MKIELISLTMDNFKCYEHVTMEFNGRDADIYGRNGTGKSSVYDGMTWLLFGKDSQGRKDFKIKPTDTEGRVKDSAAVTSVEAVLRVDGTDRKLKRTYYEVWSTKRGSAEATRNGHSSDYFVDDVPCKKGEFTRRVGEIIDENVFRLLTSITYFVSTLPWQERRAALFDIAAIATDAQILASDIQFAPLSEAMKGLTLDDYRKKLLARRKLLNGVRTDTPARLDECKKTVLDLSGIDFAALEVRKAELQRRRSEAQRELDQVEHDGGRTDLQNQLASIRNDLSRLENENTAYRLRQEAENGGDKLPTLRQSLDAVRARESRRQREQSHLQERDQRLESAVADYRARWSAINAEQFKGGVCPTCGQTLPPDKLAASKEAFERDKARRKDEAVEAANRAKAARKSIQEDLARLEQEADEDHKRADDLTSQIDALAAAPKAEIRDMDGYASQRAGMEARAAEIRQELNDLDTRSSAQRKTLREKLASVDRELSQLSSELSKRGALDYANRRMEELMAQAAAAASELNEIDKMLYLCDEFTRYKTKLIEESINSQFSLVRFRLFREQINGGLEDCCDATVGGIPYDEGLNDGARMNAGIDVINTLSRHYNAYVPLFIDNAEKVTGLERADTQMIRLVVSENDKELRCELK